jgi:hypothetical protein
LRLRAERQESDAKSEIDVHLTNIHETTRLALLLYGQCQRIRLESGLNPADWAVEATQGHRLRRVDITTELVQAVVSCMFSAARLLWRRFMGLLYFNLLRG